MPLVAGLDLDRLDDGVRQQLAGDPLGLGAVDAGQQVQPTGEHRGVGLERAAERVLDGDPGALADRVGDAGLVGDGDGHVETVSVQAPQGPRL